MPNLKDFIQKIRDKKEESELSGNVAQQLKDSYFEFFKYFWHTVANEELVVNWHIKYLCDELQKVGTRVVNRQEKEYDLVINIPPSESKSTLVLQLWNAWLWINDPTIRFLGASYSNSLSMGHAVKTRDCIRSPKFKALFDDVFEMRKDFDNKGHFKNDKGGERFVTSPSSTVTGLHFHVIGIDDPLNPSMAASPAQLANVNNWIFGTLMSRKVNEEVTVVVIVMQRLHEEDPTAKFLSKAKGVKHICLPVTNDFDISPIDDCFDWEDKSYSVSSIYNENNGLLNPIRKSKNVLLEKERLLGSREYAAQYGQNPRPLEGNLLKRDYFKIIDELLLPSDMTSIHFVADTAYTEKQENDPSACLCYGVYEDKIYLLDYIRVRQEFSQIVRTLSDFVADLGLRNSILYIEPKASGKSIFQYLKSRRNLNVVEYDMPSGDKVQRLLSVEPFLEAGKVMILKGDWNDQFIEECLVFPYGKHDESIDCLTMAITKGIFKTNRPYRRRRVGSAGRR